MPSSSSRSTYTELTLVHLYRIVFSRLLSAKMPSQTEFLTNEFALILDITKGDLARTLKPVYDTDRSTWAGWRADIKEWNELQASNAKLRRSSKILAAGNALADVGAELFRVGRSAEATRFCELGEQMWGFSLDVYDEEERLKGGGDYWSDSACDMEY